MSKKKLLFIGEASVLATGFSTIYRELLPRLAATSKYEIGEIGSYIRPDDPRINEFVKNRWKFWGTMPTNSEEAAIYNQPSNHPDDKGQNINQFGAHVFDRVCAEFKPDLVISLRDWWMDCWIERSPFRKWFKWHWQPTVDSMPQSEEWIKSYEKCDMISAYSDFGLHALRQQSQAIRLFPSPLRPGVDLQTFRPIDRASVREEFCIANDVPIVGTVVRNQKRKLILRMIDAFALMKKKYKGVKEVDKSLFLIHSAWPDNAFSFNYPRHVMRLQSYKWDPYYFKGIKDHVMQTLMCHNPDCGQISICHTITMYGKPIKDHRIYLPCMFCGKNTCTVPLTGSGVSREQLAKFYNLMDLYVHSAIAEGCSLPVQESKACFPKNTEIYTSNGYKAIQDIKKGELVMTAGGDFQPVIDTMERKFSGKLVTIKPSTMLQSVSMTDNHEVLVIEKKFRRRDSIGRYDSRDSKWIRADQVVPNKHILLYPVKKQSNKFVKTIDIGDFLDKGRFCIKDTYVTAWGKNHTGKKFEHGNCKKLPRFIEITPDLARFVGYFISEGSDNKGRTATFTFHTEEKSFHEDIMKLGKKIFGLDAAISTDANYRDGNTTIIRFESSVLANLMSKLCGHLSYNKFVHDLWFNQSDDIKSNLLAGIWNGDGSDYPYKGIVNGSFGTSSKKLAYDVLQLMLQLGYVPEFSYSRSLNAFFIKLKGNQIQDFIADISNKPEVKNDFSTDCINTYTDGFYMYFEVQDVQYKDVKDLLVYNVQVDNNPTYVTRSFIAHNCGVPNLVTDYSATAEKGRFPAEYLHIKQQQIKEEDYSIHHGGDIFKVSEFFHEPETGCYRALTDRADMADKMMKYLTDHKLREKKGRDARKCAEENYDWDKIVKQWEFVLDKVKPKDRSKTWDSPIIVHAGSNKPDCPDGLNDDQFIEWLYIEILKYPSVDPQGAEMWRMHLLQGVPRENLRDHFYNLSTQQTNEENSRQKIRAAIAEENGEKVTYEDLDPATQQEWI